MRIPDPHGKGRIPSDDALPKVQRGPIWLNYEEARGGMHRWQNRGR